VDDWLQFTTEFSKELQVTEDQDHRLSRKQPPSDAKEVHKCGVRQKLMKKINSVF
jgi:hypothetical protein